MNENVPLAIAIAVGGGSQLVTATVAAAFTWRSQVSVDGCALAASSRAAASMS